MTRVQPLWLIAVLAVGGCSTGLDGNIPLEEAEHVTPSELVVAAHADVVHDASEVVMDARLWVPWDSPLADPADTELRSVGSTHGVTLYARAWDRAPFDALFAWTDDGRWQGYAPVIGRAGTTTAMAEH